MEQAPYIRNTLKVREESLRDNTPKRVSSTDFRKKDDRFGQSRVAICTE
jgi:hypothetical protein